MLTMRRALRYGTGTISEEILMRDIFHPPLCLPCRFRKRRAAEKTLKCWQNCTTSTVVERRDSKLNPTAIVTSHTTRIATTDADDEGNENSP